MNRCSLCVLVILTFSKAENYDSGENLLSERDLERFIDTNIRTGYLRDLAKIKTGNVRDYTACELCTAGMSSALTYLEKGLPKFIVRGIILQSCVSAYIEHRGVCKGIVDEYLDIVDYMAKNGKDVTGAKICSLLLPSDCNNQFEYFNWTIHIPAKPATIPKKVVSNDKRMLRILQLTDIHDDPNYQPGAKAICGEPLCCQNDQGPADNPNEACGVWGDYRNADTPRRTLMEALRHMRTQNIDYVYFTGDIVSHRIWSTTQASSSSLDHEVMKLIKNNFNVPVLFVLGNHESSPVDSYAPLEVSDDALSTKWLYALLKDELKGIISDEDLKNIDKGGFYTAVLKPGFRVVVLNSNVCDTNNLWLAYQNYDLYGQLSWLTKVLEQAERDGEYVHLIYHIPTGDNCLGTWAREFTRIINRFSDTVSGQFNGHTHLDEFFLYFNESEPSDAINVAFNGASITTFTNSNPSYKIYTIDAQTFEVVDFEEWTFNLTAANLHPNIPTVEWYKLYSFKKAFGLSTTKPKQLYEMVKGMAHNHTLLQIYNKYKYRMGNGIDTECDDDCNKYNLCRIVTANLGDTEHCDEIKRIYDAYHNIGYNVVIVN